MPGLNNTSDCTFFHEVEEEEQTVIELEDLIRPDYILAVDR